MPAPIATLAPLWQYPGTYPSGAPVMTEACIVGWAHSPFGKLDDPDIESLIGRVAGAAIADAGIAPHEIEGTFLSLFNNVFSPQDFPSSLVLQHLPELR